MHYDRDVDDLKRDIGCLIDVQKSDERKIAALEEENERMKAENKRLLEIVYGNGRNVLRDNSNIRPVQPRMMATRTPRNPYKKKSVGPYRTPIKKIAPRLPSRVVNPYIPRSNYR